MIKILAFLPLIIAILGCGPRDGTVSEDITPGRKQFMSACSGCHILPKKNAINSDEWPQFLSSHSGFTRLNESRQALILQYLQSDD